MRKIIKTRWLISAIILALVPISSLTSCGNDEPDLGTEDPATPVSDLVKILKSGVWTCANTEYSWSFGDNPYFDSDKYVVSMFFFNDGHGVSVLSDYNHSFLDETYNKSSSRQWFTYTETSKNGIKIRFNDGLVQNLTLKGSHLDDADGGDGYTFRDFDSYELDFLKQYGPVSGSCGSGVKWSYEPWADRIVLSGSGRMTDLKSTAEQPWKNFRGFSMIDIEGAISHIGAYAFEGIQRLSWVQTSQLNKTRIESYGERCFADCIALEHIPGFYGARQIGMEAFAGCKSLGVLISKDELDNLIEIGDYVFDDTKSVSFNDVRFGSDLETIGASPFGENSSSIVTFVEGIRSISHDHNTAGYPAFDIRGSELTLPNSLENLGDLSFSGAISKIELGRGLKSVGRAAMITSSKKGDVYISATTPPSCPDDFLVGSDNWESIHSGWTLHVPEGSENAYRNAPGWRKFKIEVGSNQGDNDNPVDPSDFLTSVTVAPEPFRAIITGSFNPATYTNYKSFQLRISKTAAGLSEVTKYTDYDLNGLNFSQEIWLSEHDTKYYYSIVAEDNKGKAFSSEVYFFTTTTPRSPESCSYTLNGKTFTMVKVTGLNSGDFFIMQTELPLDADFIMDGCIPEKRLDVNNDGVVIKAEFKNFLISLRAATGIEFRLPTSSEWKYAAMGGQYMQEYKYSGSNNLDEVGWYKDNSNGFLHGVGLLKPNILDLYDMSGNYGELTNDTDDYAFVDGNLYGGYYKSSEKNCTVSSNIKQPTGGNITGTNKRENNAFDGRIYTVRLVYSVR